MSKRALVVVILVAVLVLLLAVLILHRPEPLGPRPTYYPTPTPAPTVEPSPWIEDEDLPPVQRTVLVCCCGLPGYGTCSTERMPAAAAALHVRASYLQGGHARDLFGMACASESQEDRALRRALFRPEQVEMNGRNTLAMADRAAYRERTE